MGCFDTFVNEDDSVQVQTKLGPNLLTEYRVGDHVGPEFPDAVIVGYEGFVVIEHGVVKSVTLALPENTSASLPHLTKWGGVFDPTTEKLNDHHPFASVLAEAATTRSRMKP